jgi:hypothetical protein
VSSMSGRKQPIAGVFGLDTPFDAVLWEQGVASSNLAVPM